MKILKHKIPIAVGALLIFLVSSPVMSGPSLSGDANQDSLFDMADLVTVVELLTSPSAVMGIDLLFSDADQDGEFNQSDEFFIRDVLLGRKQPFPILRDASTAVSFWYQEEPPETSNEYGEGFVYPVAAVSFWQQVDPPENPDEHFISTAQVSFWLMNETPEVGDEEDTRPTAASFWYMTPVLEATEYDTRYQGAPSFDRQ